ncbi:MAG: divalent-cation tolerance protein CutA [Candidatus Eremiobacteraeota bacterium]|nr:divalent-cation tolerance protein CutA [Candidatus Eremiobacteraeota bacterium]
MLPQNHATVTTTTDSAENAARIAEALVDARFAACVQIDGPITSRYWWDGKVETAQEWRCTIKTRSQRLNDVSQAIRRVHPYAVPEIVVTFISNANDEYRRWVDEVTKD